MLFVRGGFILRGLLFGCFAGGLAGLDFHAVASRLGQTDGDCLLGRSCAVPALPHVLDFLMHILARLGAGGFPFLLVPGRSAARVTLGHDHLRQ